MTSTTFFFVFIPLLAIILLAVNLIFAPHNPYQEKDSAFECGFHSFLGQNRTQFSISFFIFALLFLLFDLEILLVYPYVVSAYTNGIYGLVIMLIFFLALTLGFAFELGKNALKIDSRQMINLFHNKTNSYSVLYSFFLFKAIWKHFTIRNFRKYLTVTNIILGVFAIIIMALIKVSNVPMWILTFLHLPDTEYLQCVITGSLSLLARLGIKGVVIEIVQEKYLPVIKMEGTSGPSGASGPSGPSGASDSSGPSGPSGTSGSSGASRPSGPSEAEIQESIRKHMESLLLPVGKTLLPEDLFNDLKKKIGNLETIHNLSVEQAIRLSSLRRMAREHTAAVEWLVRQPTDVQTEYMRVKQRRWATDELIKKYREIMHPFNQDKKDLMSINNIIDNNNNNNNNK